MRPIKRIATLVLVLLAVSACIAGLYISAVNRDVVFIDLLFWPAVGVRSGLLVTLAFASGAVLGVIVAGLAGGARMRARDLRGMRPAGRPE